MKKIESFIGLGVAMVTPFKQDFTIDFPALAEITEYLIQNEVNYLVVLGTTGETPTLTRDEKNLIVRCVVNKTAGRVPIVVGISDNSTTRVVEEILSFDLEGVSAILSSSPYYNKPSQKGLLHHFKTIADASPRPIILYNVPGRTSVNMSVKTVSALALHENIVGIKEASGDINHLGNIIKACAGASNFYVISGDDALTLPSIALGASGVISVLGNALPAPWSAMIHASLQGNYSEARKQHYEYLELIDLLFEDGNPSGIKSVLHEFNLCENILRPPLTPAGEATQMRIKEFIQGKLPTSLQK